MPKVYLGLGGNIGDAKANINEAIKLLQDRHALSSVRRSSFYLTAPIGYEQQDWFYNVVVEADTDLSPYEMLAVCSDVEQQLKRTRLIRWGPRTIDIDILLYEDYESRDERLTIPHPRMCERAFVIVPLMELAPSLHIVGKAIEEIAKAVNNQEIRKLEDD